MLEETLLHAANNGFEIKNKRILLSLTSMNKCRSIGWYKSYPTIKSKIRFLMYQIDHKIFYIVEMATMTYFRQMRLKPPLPIAALISYSSLSLPGPTQHGRITFNYKRPPR